MDQHQLAQTIGSFIGLIILHIILTLGGNAASIILGARDRKRTRTVITSTVAGKIDEQAKTLDEVRDAQKALTSTYQQTVELKNDIIASLRQRADQQDQAITDLRSDFQKNQDQYQQDRVAFETRLTGQQQQINTLIQERDAFQAERDRALTGKNAAEGKVAALEEQVAGLTRDLTAEQAARSALEGRVEILEKQVKDMTAERAELIKQIEAITKERDDMKARAEAAEKLAAELKARLEARPAIVIEAPAPTSPDAATIAPEVTL